MEQELLDFLNKVACSATVFSAEAQRLAGLVQERDLQARMRRKAAAEQLRRHLKPTPRQS